MKWVLLLSVLLSLNLTDGARVQRNRMNQDSDVLGNRPRKFVKTSGTCKAWCMKQAVGFPLDVELLKKEANEKCHTDRGMKECKDCAGGGLTIPDCREKVMSIDETNSPERGATEATAEAAETDVPTCDKDGDYTCDKDGDSITCKVCRFQEGEICSHIEAAWCPPPSRNAGASFRKGRKPLCCSDEDDSTVEEASMQEEVQAVTEALQVEDNVAEKAPVPAPPVPVCAVGHKFKVDSFQRKGKTVNVCRDSGSGRFAKKVCCDAAAFKLLEDKQKAEDICAGVKKSWCKPDIGMFERKRKKFKEMPDTFSCKRMYFCVENGKENFGPVPSQSWCRADKTGLNKNRPAQAACFAVARSPDQH